MLTGRINYYYTRNIVPTDTLDNRLDRLGGAFQEDIKRHFNSMKRLVPEFRGVAILDGDARKVPDESNGGLEILHWQRYEIENYYITPSLIVKYTRRFFDSEGGLFTEATVKVVQEVLDERLLETVFNGDKQQLEEYKKASASLQKLSLIHI